MFEEFRQRSRSFVIAVVPVLVLLLAPGLRLGAQELPFTHFSPEHQRVPLPSASVQAILTGPEGPFATGSALYFDAEPGRKEPLPRVYVRIRVEEEVEAQVSGEKTQPRLGLVDLALKHPRNLDRLLTEQRAS